MVTHAPLPSPRRSSSSTSYRAPPSRASSSDRTASSRTASRHGQATVQLPPSPPLSFSSPPSSYVAPRQSFARSSHSPGRAPSVSSRAATTTAHESQKRRHRSSSQRRTRTEVAAPAAVQPLEQNAFPWFSSSGDVEIVLRARDGKTTEKAYLLHSLILAQNSQWFAGELGIDGHGAAKDGMTASYGAGQVQNRERRRRWFFELEWGNASDGNVESEPPMLVQKESAAPAILPPPTPKNKPPAPTTSFFRHLTNTLSGGSTSRTRSNSSNSATADADILTAYNNLFLTFYNHAPDLSTQDLPTAYVQSKALLALAQPYGALPTLAPRIDHHLLRFRRHLWPFIAKYPVSLLQLGYQARSRTILSEALVHVIGQWPAGAAQLQRRGRRGELKEVDPALLDLIEDKAAELAELRVRTENRLFRLSLTTSRGECVTATNAPTDWLALALFRDWLSERLRAAPSGSAESRKDRDRDRDRSSRRGSRSDVTNVGTGQRSPSPSTASPRATDRTLHLIYRGGSDLEAYLGHDECKRFLKSWPGMSDSRSSVKALERRLEEMKRLAKEAVRPVMWSGLEDGASGEYLSCVRLDEEDLEGLWRGR